MNYLKQVVVRLQRTASLLPSSPVASARLLVSPGAGAAAAASSPGAQPWARAASCAGPSSDTSPPPSSLAPLAAWGAALRVAAGRGAGGGGSTGVLNSRQQLAGQGTAFGAGGVLLRPAWPCSPATTATTATTTMAAVPTTGAVRSLAGSSSSSGSSSSRVVWHQARHYWRHQGTRAAGSAWRLAAFAASVTYLTLNVNDYVRHIEQMPYSGEVNTVPPSAVDESVEQGERLYTSEVASAARQGTLLPPSHPDVLLVRRVGEAVLAGMEAEPLDGKPGERLRGLRWEFQVVQGDREGGAERPLYVSPGGQVLVRTGLLDSLHRDEDTLAFLLAHELAHVALGTEATGIASERCLQGVAFVAGATCLCYGVPLLMAALGTAGLTWALDIMMPQPRTWEHIREADALASGLTVRAGFDPLPAVGYLMEQHTAAAQESDSLGLRWNRRFNELRRLISAICDQYQMEAAYAEAWGLRQGGRTKEDLEGMKQRRRARLDDLRRQWGDAWKAL